MKKIMKRLLTGVLTLATVFTALPVTQIHYPDCSDMTDVAYYFIDECQSLGEIPDRIRSYIDYEAYGRDLDLEGRFVVTNHGVFECP